MKSYLNSLSATILKYTLSKIKKTLLYSPCYCLSTIQIISTFDLKICMFNKPDWEARESCQYMYTYACLTLL